jgi:glutathione reductase (NADPH)
VKPFDYDLFVIGAGSGGVRAARMAASKGVRVAVAEDRYMGGTCVNVGCVPKKLYVYAAQFRDQFQQARGFGWQSGPVPFDWTLLRDNKKAEISRLNGIYDGLLEGAGVEIIHGRARITAPQQVEVDGRAFSAERILVATGGWPVVPEIEGRELAVTSNEIFDLERFPERILIVGGGYIAVEFAGIFNGLGARTTQLYRGDLFLRGFDQEVRRFVADEMVNKGVDLRFNLNVESLEKQADGSLLAHLTDGTTLATDAVLYATGRKPNIAGLGLEEVGVKLNVDGTVDVNAGFQTSIPSIFALGDVTGGMQLTPVALAEGMALVDALYGGGRGTVSYELIPTAVFSQPNIGTIGLTEEQACARYARLDVYSANFRAMKHTLGGGKERTLMKMLVDPESDRVVGVHMVGEDAGEILQGIAIALKAGATKAVFDSTIGIHPTAAEEFVTLRTPSRSYPRP